jgi:hypothetical protein
MDPTVLSALIGAGATIVGSVLAALIGLRIGGSRDRERLGAVTRTAGDLGRAVSTADDPEERAFLAENLAGLGEVRADTAKRAEVSIEPAEPHLALIVQKDNPRPAFNMLTRLTSRGQQVGIVDGLGAMLRGPDGFTMRFVWNLFYGRERGGLLHTLASYIHPVAIPPGGSMVLGIQFVGPDLGLAELYSWPLGRYDLELTGRLDRSSDREGGDFGVKFAFDLSAADVAQLKQWIGWDDAAWARFPSPEAPDPHRAAGRPVYIVRR